MTPVTALYALLLPAVAYALLSSSRQPIVGPEGSISALVEVVREPGDAHGATVAVGAAALAVCWPPLSRAARAGALIAVSYALDLGSHGVALVGAIPWGCYRCSSLRRRWTTCSTSSRPRSESRVNQELLAIRAAQIAAAVTQGLPVEQAIRGSPSTTRWGARSQPRQPTCRATVAAALLFLTGPITNLPKAVLGAVIVSAAMGPIDRAALRRLWEADHAEVAIAAVTTAGATKTSIAQMACIRADPVHAIWAMRPARRAATIAVPSAEADRRTKEIAMCRWMAWFGQPVLIEDVLFKTPHGIVDQSLHSRMGAETTNGDGFGIGWYGAGEGPGVYHSVEPAWSDANLRELAAHIESPLFLMHVRAAIGSPVQQTNCHPFRHGRWLFVHNGYIADLRALKRDLMLAIDPALFPDVHGSTDTEVVFHLALTFGLEDDPIRSLERTIGFIEATARRLGVDDPVQGSFGVSDGDSLWAVRYASNGEPRSLFASADPDSIRRLYPGNPALQRLGHDDRVIVSEPFSDLPGVWHEIPPSTAVTVRRGGVLEQQPFHPESESLAAAGAAAGSTIDG